MSIEDPVYGVIAESRNKRILVVKGRPTGKWSFPKGHCESNESGIQCASREAHEETGIAFKLIRTARIELSTGYYYNVFVNSEIAAKPRDDHEIICAAWLTRDQLRYESVNLDVSTFLRRSRVNTQSCKPRPCQLLDMDGEDLVSSISRLSIASVQL